MTTNNGDMPAYPLTSDELSLGANDSGLTKREKFAMAAMQGLLASKGLYDSGAALASTAAQSVRYADVLLAELEKQQ